MEGNQAICSKDWSDSWSATTCHQLGYSSSNAASSSVPVEIDLLRVNDSSSAVQNGNLQAAVYKGEGEKCKEAVTVQCQTEGIPFLIRTYEMRTSY